MASLYICCDLRLDGIDISDDYFYVFYSSIKLSLSSEVLFLSRPLVIVLLTGKQVLIGGYDSSFGIYCTAESSIPVIRLIFFVLNKDAAYWLQTKVSQNRV